MLGLEAAMASVTNWASNLACTGPVTMRLCIVTDAGLGLELAEVDQELEGVVTDLEIIGIDGARRAPTYAVGSTRGGGDWTMAGASQAACQVGSLAMITKL